MSKQYSLCPFCGHKPNWFSYNPNYGQDIFVECNNPICGIGGIKMSEENWQNRYKPLSEDKGYGINDND